MTSIAKKLSNILGDAFEAQGLPRELGLVRVSDRPDLAQFQCNGAMAAAKLAKKNPREIAQSLTEYLSARHSGEGRNLELSKDDLERDPDLCRDDNNVIIFSSIEIAGPGFINLNVTDEFLRDYLSTLENLGVETVGDERKIILDYGGPNAAKSLHVGHLRSGIIGTALRHIFLHKGYDVLGDIHLGDWGTQMGMLIGDYLRNNEQALITDADPDNMDDVKRAMADFSVRYPKASSEAKANPDLMQEARDITLKLQNKEEPYFTIWKNIRSLSLADMKVIYDKLNVTFDLWKGEADVNDLIAPMVKDLKERKIAYESDGALVVGVETNEDKKKVPPLILTKSDGAALYSTTDIATIMERVNLYQPTRIIYVVDQRQSLHFEQVFRAVKKADIVDNDLELTHAGFGTMNGTDGTPFKTRSGGVMPLKDFIDDAVAKALARLDEVNLAEEITPDEREDIANKVAIAAIKFADLQNPRQSDYIFDLDKMTGFEGKTGPYLLYQAVRIKSLLKKASQENFKNAPLKIEEQDRNLILLMGEFSDTLDLTMTHYSPHYLADYLYRLAQAFSSYYGNVHILSENDEALRHSRLLLIEKTSAYLTQGLALLGIEIPERM